MTCMNATCCHKLPLMLIGNYNRPANQICPLEYAVQKCVWMDVRITSIRLFILKYAGELVTQLFCFCTMIQGISKGKCCGAFFTTNVINWKQPCDLGVIAAVKKSYKFLLLKDMLSFYQLDTDNQQLKKFQNCQMIRWFSLWQNCTSARYS